MTLVVAVTLLARYTFLLEPASEEADFLKPKNALTGEILVQNVHAARYLAPKFSIWMSADPALGEYIQAAPVSDDARKHNENWPGMGGVYNSVNLNLYHYAGNNPIRYTDPDGKNCMQSVAWNINLRFRLPSGNCVLELLLIFIQRK